VTESLYENLREKKWTREHSKFIHELSLHDEKICVWCVISAHKITGLIFYDNTVNAARYVNNILSPFCAKLTEEERLYCVFQQDSATAHISLEALWEVFGGCVISHSLWPPCSPDLTPCDFYLCGSLKDKMYKTNPHTLKELRNNIHHEISTISGEKLQRNTNMFYRYTECIWSGGQNSQHLRQHW
jgi:hypothetical protein